MQANNHPFSKNLPHASLLDPPPQDFFSCQLPRSNYILEARRRVPPGVWDIDFYDVTTNVSQRKATELSGDHCLMRCRHYIDHAVRFGLW